MAPSPSFFIAVLGWRASRWIFSCEAISSAQEDVVETDTNIG